MLAFLTGEGVTWKLVGWLFYNVHLVSVRIPGLFGGTTRNFATGADDPGVVAALALPPLLLGLAGLAAAWRTSGDRSVSARNGAAVALGYLPPSVAGAFLFELSAGDATAGPVVLTAVLVAGLAYPLVLGAVGGGLGPVLADALTGD